MEQKRIIADRYELERLAGTGAMGSVYRAWDRKLGKAVALKLVHDPADAPRFDREAAALESIDHPGIVRYESHGRSQRSEAYIAMEWLEGETLSSRLDRGTLSVEQALALGSAVAHALSAAHAAGIVHRDLKPGNILLVGGSIDRPKLVDFGIAHSGQSSGDTHDGEWLGTPGYMPPEQIRAGGRPTPASDVYALGCVLYRAISGRLPHEGQTAVEILQKAARQDAPRLGELVAKAPPALEQLLAAMLARDVADRPGDGTTAAARLDALVSRRRPAQPLAQAARAARQRRTRASVAGIGIAIALFLGALLLLTRARREGPVEGPGSDMRTIRRLEDAPGKVCVLDGQPYDRCTPLPDGAVPDLVTLMGPVGVSARSVEPTASLTGMTARCEVVGDGAWSCAPRDLNYRYRYRRQDGLFGSLVARLRAGHIVIERSDEDPGSAVRDPPACKGASLFEEAQVAGLLDVDYAHDEKLDIWRVRSAHASIRLDAARCKVID